MTYTVIWSPAALRTFYELPPHTAMIVDRAVYRLAERGEGYLRWVAPYHRLRAGLHEVALRRDEQEQTIYVLFLYLARRSSS
jgi:mRNA-degrading endonuclease RelE of RelBE toxin-antitoxin system